MNISTDNGTAAKPALRFENDPDSGRYLNAAGDVRDCVGATDVVKLTPMLVQALVLFDASQGLKIAGGATVAKLLKATAAWTPGLIAQGDSATITVTVTGAAVGDPVMVGGNLDASATKVNVTGSVTAPDTVVLCASCNNGVNSITPGAATFTVVVLHMG